MRADDFEGFRELMQGVHDFYGKDLSPFGLDVWWNAMQPYDLDVVRRAVSMHCVNPDSGQFCPKPADVVRMVGGTTKDAAIMAWNKVQAAISSVGTYKSVCFDDPIINRVLHDMGGWPDIGMKELDELPFIERNFCDRYRAYKVHGGPPGHPPYLVGITEASNSARGYRADPPMLVGNAERAMAVMIGGSDVRLTPITVGEHVGAMKLIASNLEAA